LKNKKIPKNRDIYFSYWISLWLINYIYSNGPFISYSQLKDGWKKKYLFFKASSYTYEFHWTYKWYIKRILWVFLYQYVDCFTHMSSKKKKISKSHLLDLKESTWVLPITKKCIMLESNWVSWWWKTELKKLTLVIRYLMKPSLDLRSHSRRKTSNIWSFFWLFVKFDKCWLIVYFIIVLWFIVLRLLDEMASQIEWAAWIEPLLSLRINR